MVRRKRYRKNPSTAVKVAMVGGGALGVYLLYSKFFAGSASAATSTQPGPLAVPISPITVGPAPEPGIVGTLTGAVKSVTTGLSNIFSTITGGASAMADVDKFKAYQSQLNALGAKLVINGIVGQKTLDANNKYMPMKYTSIALLKSAILGGVAGVAGLGNYYLEA
jgi:hypothetical protein